MTEQDRDEPSRDDIPPLRSRGGPSPSRFDAPPLQRRGGPSREPSPEPATRRKKKGRGSSTPRSSSPRSTPRSTPRSSSTPRETRTPRQIREDRAELVRIANRTVATPGPGEYTPPVVRSTIGGESMFRARDSRFMSTKSVREMMSDPGKYKLEKDRTCASVSDNAFGKSERSGSQGFVSVSKRPEFGILHKMRDTPFAIYETRPPWLEGDVRGNKPHLRGHMSPGFLSKVQRSAWMISKNKLAVPSFAKYYPEKSHEALETKMRDRQKMATLSSIMPRFRGDETISPGPAGHVPNNHTLERGARESCRDYRAMTGTREDLFRTPRVKPRIKTPRETVRV